MKTCEHEWVIESIEFGMSKLYISFKLSCSCGKSVYSITTHDEVLEFIQSNSEVVKVTNFGQEIEL